jgi:hypothetical protein
MIKVLNNKKELADALHTVQKEGIKAIYRQAVNSTVTEGELCLMGDDAMRRIVAFSIWQHNTVGDTPHCLQVSKSRRRLADLRAFIMQLCGFNSRNTLRKIIKKGKNYEQKG